MNPFSRYDTSALEEAQFQPGSRGRVLKNLLGIQSKREMDRAEAREQLRALEDLVKIYSQTHRFTASDIRKIHKIWLGNVYTWAGQYRLINLSKGKFPFAAARHIPNLMEDLEKGPLRKFTPCRYSSLDKIVEAISVVHTELVLIHPFRDGNGRVGRLLAILMALQAGLPPLDFSGIAGKKKKAYFTAVQEGMTGNYGMMEEIFKGVIDRTLRLHG
jgi:cell filamentation protein